MMNKTGCEIMKCKRFSEATLTCTEEGGCVYNDEFIKKEIKREVQKERDMYQGGESCGKSLRTPPAATQENRRGSVIVSLEEAERAASRLTEAIGELRERMECMLSEPINKGPGTSAQVVPTNPQKTPLSEQIDTHTYVLESLVYQVNQLRQRLEV
jgi:hypothetical protein